MFRDSDSSWMFWDNDSRGMMGRSWWPGTLLWIGFIVIVVVLVVVILFSRNKSPREDQSSSNKSAKELLDIRFAKGEISEEEYIRMRKQVEE